jgi:endonuclease YncB( thermonuclease family)
MLMVWALLLLSLQVAGISLSGIVTAVKDGDTIEIISNGLTTTVRLEHIDCPEKGQDFGKRAKQFTSNFCYGKSVRVETRGQKDRYGRVIGVVYLADGANLNLALVDAGYAWHFRKYSKDRTYARAEDAARKARLGLWASDFPIAPWDWRKMHRNR